MWACAHARPVGLLAVRLYHDRRFGARESRRPGVPAGSEHAIRVAAATRARTRYSPRARVGYQLMFPGLLAGALPSTRRAQTVKGLINKLTPDECDQVTSLAEVEIPARGRQPRVTATFRPGPGPADSSRPAGNRPAKKPSATDRLPLPAPPCW